MSTTDLAVATGLVFADARRLDLPDPIGVAVAQHNPGGATQIHLQTLADLAQWAQWAEAPIEHSKPKHWDGDKWTVHHTAEGSIAELPVMLVAVEIGVMTEPDTFDCTRCGAKLGTRGGFVPLGAYDDSFERMVARHQDGACAFAAVTL